MGPAVANGSTIYLNTLHTINVLYCLWLLKQLVQLLGRNTNPVESNIHIYFTTQSSAFNDMMIHCLIIIPLPLSLDMLGVRIVSCL